MTTHLVSLNLSYKKSNRQLACCIPVAGVLYSRP